MKTKNKILTLILIFFATACSFFCGCASHEELIKSYISEKWLPLSENDRILYDDDRVSWQSEGMFYAVIKLFEEPDDVLFEKEPDESSKKYSFYTNAYATGTEEECMEYRQNFIKRCERLFGKSPKKGFYSVPEEFRPNWDGEVMLAGVMADEFRGTSYYYNVDSSILIILSMVM